MMRSIPSLHIGNRMLGNKRDIFISAEVGTTCNGDVETAKRLIDAAVDAGMDAVKFQILNPDEKFSNHEVTFSYTRSNGERITENLYEMLKQYVMPPSAWREIKAYADSKGIILFATPDYEGGVDLMEELNMPAFKIATWDAGYYPFVRKIAKLKKPTIVDLGASPLEEVARIVKVFEEEQNDQVILLHCFHTTNYAEMNLETISYLRETFGYWSGFSAPDTNNDIDYAALAFGPVYIEKRLTLDRNDPRHHHAQALEPKEMKEYVSRVRSLVQALGEFKLVPTKGDLELRKMHFRSIVAKKLIQPGETLSLDNLTCRRPYSIGLDPMYLDVLVGRVAASAIEPNQPVTWDLVQ